MTAAETNGVAGIKWWKRTLYFVLGVLLLNYKKCGFCKCCPEKGRCLLVQVR
jgi:hypothetical protein